jgi:hypothetical protein
MAAEDELRERDVRLSGPGLETVHQRAECEFRSRTHVNPPLDARFICVVLDNDVAQE